MYKVLVDFADLEDNGHVYKAGDTFPRKGVEPSESRIKELSTASNKRGVELIKKMDKAPVNGENGRQRKNKKNE